MTIILCKKIKQTLNSNACCYFSLIKSTTVRGRRSNQNLEMIQCKFHVGSVDNSSANCKDKNSVDKDKQNNNKETVFNPCGIQMISKSLHQQTFRSSAKRNQVSKEVLAKVEKHLVAHNLWGRTTPALPNVDLKLPPLCGKNLDDHFRKIADKQCKNYRNSLIELISKPIPSMPKIWQFYPGWIQYDKEGNFKSVEFPEEDAYIFDVEVCVKEGHLPTLATAVSNNHWYSWCSNQLYYQETKQTKIIDMDTHRHYTLKDLINLETRTSQNQLPLKHQKERLVIGHNVAYDRARVKEQYFLSHTKLRFLDTMAMHIAISGMTNYQQRILKAEQNDVSNENEILKWQNVTSTNGLAAVHKLYYGGKDLDKQKRNTFVEGSLSEIKEDFQKLMTYCASDTLATYQVLVKLTPQYLSRFPHPVTLAAIIEMGTVFLPVNRNWQRYLEHTEETYCELKKDLSRSWKTEVNSVCHLLDDASYRKDPWLWDLDWSVSNLKVKKSSKVASKSHQNNEADEDQFQSLMESKDQLYKISPLLPGYPNWYRSLYTKDKATGSFLFSSSLRIVPKLLKMTWDGYPLYHNQQFGWGYLVPGRPLEYSKYCSETGASFPLKEALTLCPVGGVNHRKKPSRSQEIVTIDEAMNQLRLMTSETADQLSLAALWQAARAKRKPVEVEEKRKKSKGPLDWFTPDRPAWHQGIGPYEVGIPGCWFYRLPHRLSKEAIVGSPLSKELMSKIEEGILQSTSSTAGQRILELYKMIKDWQRSRDRIISQMVVRLDRSQLPSYVSDADDFDPYDCYGAILPLVVVTGTLTRRPVEPTWIKGSQSSPDLGSEYKAMIQCPPGMNMISAEFDAQTWIASVIGDASFGGLHGSTAFGWLTLQGKECHRTDVHSRVASTLSITHDQAKVLNYARFYGAGEGFIKTLLMKFNTELTFPRAVEVTRQLYSVTRGKCVYQLNDKGRQLAEGLGYAADDTYTAETLAKMCACAALVSRLSHFASAKTEDLVLGKCWSGGTESEMFNKLEEMALRQAPATPVLQSRITRALEPANAGAEFTESRLSWLVQSTAVDYLHLVIVAMRHLFDVYRIGGRLCITINDQVRYLVKSEDRFRAALALQIAHLWASSMVAYQLGLHDLPQSVAFLSSIHVDTVVRTETSMDCPTPSNPHGLKHGYGVPPGQCYDIHQILFETKGTLQR